jgi:hypothetical protein
MWRWVLLKLRAPASFGLLATAASRLRKAKASFRIAIALRNSG